MRRNDSSGEGGNPPNLGTNDATAAGESHIREEEVYRMAAFRIRETANRIATLANGVRDDALRTALLQACERLLSEERTLLERIGQG